MRQDFLQRIKAAFSAFNAPASGAANGAFGIGKNRITLTEQSAYEQVEWISTAVDIIKGHISAKPWLFVNAKNGEFIPDNKINKKVVAPFANGYAGNTISQMLGACAAQMLLTGNALFFLGETTAYANALQSPDALIPVRSWSINMDGAGLAIKSYRITIGNKTIIVPPEVILHFRNDTIFSPFVGVGNITKLRLIAEGEVEAQNFVNNFITNGAAPSLAVIDQKDRNIDVVQKIHKDLINRYSGTDKAGALMYLYNGMTVQNLQTTIKDLQFIEQKKYNRQTILSKFGVPPVVASIPDGANKAIAQEMRRQFYGDVNNIMAVIEQTINLQFVHKIDERVSFKLDRYATGDVESIVQMVNNGIINPNRASELLGEDFDLKDASRNSFYVSAGLVPLGYTGTAEEDSGEKEFAGGKKETCACHKKHINSPLFVDDICAEALAAGAKQWQVKYLRASLLSRNSTEAKYTPKLSAFFEAQGERVVGKLKEYLAQKNAPRDDIDPELLISILFGNDETSELREIIGSVHKSAITKAVKDVANISRADLNLDLTNPKIKAELAKLGTAIKEIDDTTRRQVKDIIIRAVNESWNIEDIYKNVQQQFQNYESWHARTIARSESRAAWDAAAVEGYKELDVKFFDVIGCSGDDDWPETKNWCNRQNIPVSIIDQAEFHPNHIGAIVPHSQPIE
ncbi:phage portal protein [Candidatus Termititenax aidoneus]|uniref:Phage portal protein n=1 Tax=Termititenax aidoneus TaxID=2218524 RepID=A0A388TEW8_TERA1|nr:phage portal protein [Candidatus Termititenax aidoneus]